MSLVAAIFKRMNLRALLVVPVAALALSACGGSGEDATTPTSAAEQATQAEDRGPVTTRDVDDLGAKLGDAGWGDPGVGCGESLVDMAGYPKVVCIIPDEYAEPGQSGNAVSVMTFTEWDQADAYVAEYGDETTVVEDGFIVDGPHSTAVDAAVQILTK